MATSLQVAFLLSYTHGKRGEVPDVDTVMGASGLIFVIMCSFFGLWGMEVRGV